MTELSCAPASGAEPREDQCVSAPTATRLLERVDVGRSALGATAGIVALAAMGGMHALARDGGPGVRIPAFGLDQEWSVPAFFSAGLLFAAAAACVLAATAGGLPDVRAGALHGLGALFAFMGADEVLQIHERLERVADAGWQRLYAPLMLVAGVLWLLVLRGLRVRTAAAALFCAGALAWAVAQFFERIQRDGEVLLHRWTILPEEVLEMTGSTLFCLALVVGARAAADVRVRA